MTSKNITSQYTNSKKVGIIISKSAFKKHFFLESVQKEKGTGMFNQQLNIYLNAYDPPCNSLNAHLAGRPLKVRFGCP